jgi:hypothetical protein
MINMQTSLPLLIVRPSIDPKPGHQLLYTPIVTPLVLRARLALG